MITQTTYNIIKVSAKHYLDIVAGHTLPICDLSPESFSPTDSFVSTDEHNDCPLFYQIMSCLKELHQELRNDDAALSMEFTKSVLIFDFQYAVKSPKLALLFPDSLRPCGSGKKKTPEAVGIPVIFRKGEAPRFFVPFDKSASMGRKSLITFIDRNLRDILEPRITMGFFQNTTETSLSKYYAYRGLYLSESLRVDPAKLDLSAETVVVLKDQELSLPDLISKQKVSLFSAVPDATDAARWNYNIQKESNEGGVSPFDGEGLISFEYAETLRKHWHKVGNPDGVTSFQIRMPFIKGILHAVDFRGFLEKELHFRKGAPLIIEDFFGRHRDLRKAQIILTESMLKCVSLLSLKNHKQENQEWMEQYFHAFHQYDHALYISGTDIPDRDPETTALNYQFLSTLKLSDDDLDAFQRSTIDTLVSLEKDLRSSGAETLTEFDSETGEVSVKDSSSEPGWLTAFRKNPAFAKDPFVKRELDSIRDQRLRGIFSGRFIVPGTIRFLSGDLLSFLLHLGSDILREDKSGNSFLYKCSGKDFCKHIEKLKKHCSLIHDSFYLPAPGSWLRNKNYYAFFRNPHLSRCEQCLLRPYSNRLYDTWFSHLHGVVMVSYHSLAPMTLGGADFDGDYVKIIADRRIVKSVADNVYHVDMTAEGKDSPNTVQYRRSLPLLKIPSVKPKRVPIPDSIPANLVKDTFSNHVGEISNLAIRFAVQEYSDEAGFSEACPDKMNCEKCSIVVGLDIDAAKNGSHPEKNIQELRDKAISKEIQENSSYLEIKDMLDGIDRIINIKENKDTFSILSTDSKTARIPAGKTGLGKLGEYFCRAWTEIKGSGKNDSAASPNEPSEGRMFLFEDESSILKKPGSRAKQAWVKALNNKKLEDTKALIEAWHSIQQKYREYRRLKDEIKDLTYTGHIQTILMLQYGYVGILSDDTMEDTNSAVILNLVNRMQFEAGFRDQSVIDEALSRLRRMEWQNTPRDDRPRVLSEILGVLSDTALLTPDEKKVLCNFRNQGYMLLYYMLLTLREIAEKKAKLAEAESPAPGGKENPASNPWFSRLWSVCKSCAEKKSTNKVFLKCLNQTVRACLEEILADDKALAVRYVYACRTIDKNADFFWKILPYNMILNEVLECPGKEDPQYAE